MAKFKKKVKKKQYKSSLERWFAVTTKKLKLRFEYEPTRFKFVKVSHYVPDFQIRPGVFIETKGYFSSADRSKLLAFREQFPDIEIRLLFGNSRNRLNPHSKRNYAQWAEQHGFKWADMRGPFPKEWWDS